MDDKELVHDTYSNGGKSLLLAEHRTQTEHEAPAQILGTWKLWTPFGFTKFTSKSTVANYILS